MLRLFFCAAIHKQAGKHYKTILRKVSTNIDFLCSRNIKQNMTAPANQTNLMEYLYQSVSKKNLLKFLLMKMYQGPLCDLSIATMDNKHVNCHLLIIGGLSPYFLKLVQEVGGDSLIIPDYTSAEVLFLMNLIYTGKYDF